MRVAFFAGLAALFMLTGCVGAFDPLQRPGSWVEEGAANETIAQQAANPADLISGQSAPTTSGTVAVEALNKVTVVSGSGSGSGGGSSGGGSSSGSGSQ